MRFCIFCFAQNRARGENVGKQKRVFRSGLFFCQLMAKGALFALCFKIQAKLKNRHIFCFLPQCTLCFCSASAGLFIAGALLRGRGAVRGFTVFVIIAEMWYVRLFG